jgi:ATP-binding cassette, subfamily C, bacterial CydC
MKALLRLIGWQWSYHRAAFAGGALIALVPAVAGIALLAVSGWFITAAALAGLSGVFLNIFLPSALIRAFAIARTAGRYGERILTHDATFRFLTDLRCKIFEGYANQAGNGHRPRSGIALNRLTSDIAALDAVYLRLIVPGVLASVVGVLAIVWAGTVLTVLAAGPIIMAAFVLLLGISAVLRRKGQAARRQEAALDAVRLRTVDFVAGRRDLAVYGGLDGAVEAICSASSRLAEAEEASEARVASSVAWSGFAGQAGTAVTLGLVTWQSASGALGAAMAVAVLLVMIGLPEVLGAVVPGLSNIGRTRLAARRAVSRAGNGTPGSQMLSNTREAAADHAAPVLEFKGVSFGYPSAGRSVLSGLSFSIAPGEWLAIVGKSGCGKSTVSSLASGLLDAGEGDILVSGQSIGAMEEGQLRKRITVLGQKPYLFHDSVASNLRVANPQASDEDLWQALDMAALGDRIRDTDTGLQTKLGEGGIGLSGGEQRRLGLARAYLTQPDLFILDELTEGLDAATAAEVIGRFQRMKGDAAVLMIAHKSDEITCADRVLRLDAADGALVNADAES